MRRITPDLCHYLGSEERMSVVYASKRKLVKWSPHNENEFLVAANDLRLYTLKSVQRPTTNGPIRFSLEEGTNLKI